MKNIDLTKGSILRALFSLAIPITITGFVEMAYTFTDMFWVGMKGADYVSAVGACGNFVWLAVCVITIPRVGGQIKVGHCLGAKDISNAKQYIKSALQIGLFIILCFSLVFFFLPEMLIGVFNFDSQLTINLSIKYLQVQAFGIIPYAITLILTGIFTAMGNTKAALMCNGIGLIVNIILDPIFIYYLDLGATGAAIATSIAEVVVFVAFVYYIYKNKNMFSGLNFFSFESQKIKEIVLLGITPAIQAGIFAVVSLFIGRLIATYGTYAVGVQKVGAQLESISWKTSEGLGSAINSFTAQNYGAGRLDRARKAYKISFIFLVAFGLISAFILFVFPNQLMGVFFKEEEAIATGVNYLYVMGFAQVFMCLEIVTNGALAGLGITFLPNFVCTLIICMRIPMAILLSSTVLHINGIWWSITISCILTGIASFSIYLVLWKKRFAKYVCKQKTLS